MQHSARQISFWLIIKVGTTFGQILLFFCPQDGLSACIFNTAVLLSLLMVHITVLKYTHRPIAKSSLSQKISSISRRLIKFKKSYSSQKSIVYSIWKKRQRSCSKSAAKSSRASLRSRRASKSLGNSFRHSSHSKSLAKSSLMSLWRRKASKSQTGSKVWRK